MQQLICLHGSIGSGKDTAAKFLNKWVHQSFAEPLKKMALAIDPLVRLNDRTYLRLAELVVRVGYEKAKEHDDVRRFLQRLGTEGCRGTFGKDCWVKLAASNMPEDRNCVFTDGRFENELNWIRQSHGVVVNIVGPNRRRKTTEAAQHASEQALPDHLFHYRLYNTGTLAELKKHMTTIARSKTPSVLTTLGEPIELH